MSKFLTKITNITGRAGLTLQKRSPELLMAGGILGIVGTVVLACRETLKAGEVIEKHHKMKRDVAEMRDLVTCSYDQLDDPEEDIVEENLYSSSEIRREVVIMYAKTTGNFIKLYAPSVALGSLSLACILTSNNILKKRYLGAVAAYNAVSGAFEAYRERVREEMGEDTDRRFLYGEKRDTLEVVDEKGKKTGKKEEVALIEGEPSGYARYFDKSCVNWDEDPTMSLMFLKAQQEIATHILDVRGHLFLNEVYDMLGFPHTQAGAVVGWVKGMGDSYVDFGLYDTTKESVRRFINGHDNVILLDFNVDGVILDKI